MNKRKTILGLLVLTVLLLLGYLFFVPEDEEILEIEFVEIDINGQNSQNSRQEHVELYPKRYQKGTSEWIYQKRYYPVNSFCIGKYEITNKQFSIFLNAYKSDILKNTSPETPLILTPNIGLEKSWGKWKVKPGFENKPVVNVTYAGVREFCDYFGFGVPSNQEIAYLQRRTFSKNDWSDFKEPLPIGSKQPNILGIYDLDGNVHEICGYSHGNPSGPSYTYMGGVENAEIAKFGESESIYKNHYASDIAGFRVAAFKDELEKNENYKILYQRDVLQKVKSPKQIEFMKEAWLAFNDEDYKLAIELSDKAISKYSEEAKKIQNKLLICPQYKRLGDTEKLLLFEAYILNDVTVAHYIKGESYVKLYEKSNKRKKEYWEKARETFYELFDFECGVCWDSAQQKFWSPYDVIIERYGVENN